MAEEDDLDLDLRPADAGALFRAEMATTNFIMGYWKVLLGILIVGLVGILLFGQYRDHVLSQQKDTAHEVAMAEAELGAPLIMLDQALEGGDVDNEKVAKVAKKLLGVAENANGAARVEAGLKAAEAFRVAGMPAERRLALESAAPYAEGVLAYSAYGALANLDLEEGNVDGAIQRWQELLGSEDGYLAEQAMLELGLVYEATGRPDEARKIYADFMTKYPDSSRYGKAEQRDARLAAAQG